VCSILHATPSVKERCIALGHRNKKGDFNDLADEMHNPYATNAGGSKKKKIKKKTLSSDGLHGSVLLSRSPHAPSLTSRFSRAAQRSGDVGKLINIQRCVRG